MNKISIMIGCNCILDVASVNNTKWQRKLLLQCQARLLLLNGVGGGHRWLPTASCRHCLSVPAHRSSCNQILAWRQHKTPYTMGGRLLITDVFQSPVTVPSVRLVAGKRWCLPFVAHDAVLRLGLDRSVAPHSSPWRLYGTN